MTAQEVNLFARHGLYEGQQIRGKLEETHISWVVLTPLYVFKIKKPVKTSFLDFSTLALRKHFCERELELNRRFADIYLSVQPIHNDRNIWTIGEGPGEVKDYCVVMKKMAIAKRMDNCVRKGNVRERSMHTLALKIGKFHLHAQKVFTPFDLAAAQNIFNDISSIGEGDTSGLDRATAGTIPEAIAKSNDFLTRHAARFQQRVDQGLKRDVHGDLHTGNIFLYAHPVIFDCIEFNDAYRQIDVLYEVAFLCMDLEASGEEHLAAVFLRDYRTHFPAFQSREDELLFIYFKALRANVRAKVHAMGATQAGWPMGARHQDEMYRYLRLMKRYLDFL